MDALRTCTGCHEAKATSAYYVYRKTGRLFAKCKVCRGEANRDWKIRNPDLTRALNRAGHLKRMFSITQEQYDGLLERQGGGCGICGAAPVEGRCLDVDHDHACCPGKRSCGECIRGLLCWPCNSGIGKLCDDLTKLRRAVAYLEAAA